ncbi:hypothetical protein KWH37_21855, partial [Xanthomonas campestris pv. carissae]|nr:hypothetical protein [Xanthomonas campestris pv. carissae]
HHACHEVGDGRLAPLLATAKSGGITDTVAESDFEFEQWISDLVIERIEDETGTLIACDYEDHVPDIDDL